MRNQLPLEFDFQREVLPALAVGLVLNLAGRYFAAAYLQLPWIAPDAPNFIFLDQVGTAFVAVLLGPWWGATVGILASAITGLFASNFFPFGTTSIAAGLAWGYAARLPWIRARLAFAPGHTSVRDMVYACVWLAVLGAVISDAVSTVTKIVLYTRLELPLDLGRSYYVKALSAADALGVPFPVVTSLLAADFVRELLDKSLTLAFALVFLMAFGFIPNGVERDRSLSSDSRIHEQLKVSALSIFSFTIVYALYLFAARLTTTQITYAGASQSIFWLQDRTVLVMLYSPLVCALAAFLLLSFDANSRLGQSLDAERRKRSRMYSRMLFRPGQFEWSELFRVVKRESVYGLLATAFLWPTQVNASSSAVSATYSLVVLAFATVFFHERRQFSERWYKANDRLEGLHQWMTIGRIETSHERMLDILWESLGRDTFLCDNKRYRTNHVAFYACVIDGNAPMARHLYQQRRNDGVLLVVPGGAGTMSEAVCCEIETAMTNAGCDLAVVVTTTPEPVEAHLTAWLRALSSRGRDIVLIGWDDVEDAIFAAARRDDVARLLAYSRMRTMGSLSVESSAMAVDATPSALASRALRSLSYLITHLPRGSRVFDVGGGRGRHTLAAALRGHRVAFVERRPEPASEIEAMLDPADRPRVVLRCQDYRSVTVEDVGPADLVIVTGVLQHTRSREELAADLRHFKTFLADRDSVLYLEMLFDMLFDARPATDGRHVHSQQEFEAALLGEFPHPWRVERVRGPYCRIQDFTRGPRSFIPTAMSVKSTSVEYMLVHGS